jgi:hypothetical protein
MKMKMEMISCLPNGTNFTINSLRKIRVPINSSNSMHGRDPFKRPSRDWANLSQWADPPPFFKKGDLDLKKRRLRGG